jgi:antitoxin component of RelBE/YafQ-DinJ toxin-antitoxin module
VERMTERLDVRISRADREQAKATGRSLGLSTSEYVRMTLRERAQLEAALGKQSDTEGGSNGSS